MPRTTASCADDGGAWSPRKRRVSRPFLGGTCVALRGVVNGAWVDLLRMGHGRINCVTPKVALAASGARSFEEVAAPRSVHARLIWLCALLLASLTLAACNSAPV